MTYVTTIPHDLKNGDMLLFSGTGLISRLIKFGGKTPWSHVGLIYDGDVLHSTTKSPVEDIDYGHLFSGVQLNKLRDLIALFPGEVWLRRLNTHLSDEQEDDYNAFFTTHIHKPYEVNLCDLLNAEFDMGAIDSEVEDLSSLFCSELVAEFAEEVLEEYLPVPSDEYTPKDCAKSWTTLYTTKLVPIKRKLT